MKGIQGLILAIGLGVAGALFNWAYLAGRSSREEMVAFVGIKGNVTVNRGEMLRDDDLVPVRIPLRLVGNLKDFAMLYGDKGTVIGQRVCRNMTGECLLLRDDLTTPPQKLDLEEGESVMWIPVDTRAFVPSLVKPGDMVSFLVSRPSLPTPAVPGRPRGPADDGDDSPSGPIETIGPFKILALGNRLGSSEVMRAAKVPQLQESVLAIRVSDHVAGERRMAEKLWSLLQAANFRNVGVTLHNRKD
ncbi:MAG: hypothetical protein KKE86_06135 [Planctomycetes bacterium]|nr:hypothetical protein [Planctomycetota bacterium]